MEKQYLPWIDFAKAIGIFFVIYGHGGLSGNLVNYIYSFHMPMFFIVSGMLYKPLSLRQTFYKNWRGLMLPYLLLNVICWIPQVFSMIINNAFTYDKVFRSWVAVLLGLGYNTHEFMPISTPCWFIYTLFISKIIVSLCPQGNRSWLIFLSLASLLSTIVLQHFNVDLLVPLDSALMAIPFICLGYMCKKWIVAFVQSHKSRDIALGGLLSLLWVLLVDVNGRVDMCICKVGNNMLLFYVIAIVGSLVFFQFSDILYSMLKCWNKIMGGGKNSVSQHTPLCRIQLNGNIIH